MFDNDLFQKEECGKCLPITPRGDSANLFPALSCFSAVRVAQVVLIIHFCKAHCLILLSLI